MYDHLPECPYQPEIFSRGQFGQPCICPELRTCEQRVLLSKPNIELSAVYGYEAGRLDGLRAARDAVAEAVANRGGYHSAAEFTDCALAAIDNITTKIYGE